MDIPILRISKAGILADGRLLRPPFFSFWDRWKHLRGRSLVIGFIGPRGSGKTTCAVRTLILDYMLKGRRVWSDDLPIAFDVATGDNIVPFRSIPMGDDFKFGDCYNGCVFMDEINEGEGDSYRSMSGKALELSYDLQELRKGADGGLSKMDVIWTTQSEMFSMPRIRFQTDIIIKCHDLSLTNKKVGMGEYSRWEIWDYTGIVKGTGNASRLKESPVVFIKPWWHTFKTGTKKREEKRAREQEARAQQEAETQELYELAGKVARTIKLNKLPKVLKGEIWQEYKIFDSRQQRLIVKFLAEHGIVPDASGRSFCDYEQVRATL